MSVIRLVSAESADRAESEPGSVSLVDGRGGGADGLHLLQRRGLEGRLYDGRSGVRLVGQSRGGRVELNESKAQKNKQKRANGVSDWRCTQRRSDRRLRCCGARLRAGGCGCGLCVRILLLSLTACTMGCA